MIAKKLLCSLLFCLVLPSVAAAASTTEKSWEELTALTGGKVVFTFKGNAWFCLAQAVPTTCTLGPKPPGKGCYVILTEDWTAWVAPKMVARRLGGKFVTGSEGYVEAPDGPGCGEVQEYDYWLVIE